jgi:acetyltransferase-like isoleucine patch superfamily enzyme
MRSWQAPPLEDPLTLASRALTKLYSLWVRATYPFASCGRGLSIHYAAEIRRTKANRISLGNSVLIAKDAWINISNPAESDEPVVLFGDGCIIARRSMISARNRIQIEQNVILSPSVLIMDHSHSYEDVTVSIESQGVTEGGTIRIGEGSWIGHGAAIVCNRGDLVLGRNCVVAANALVTRSFPPYSVISGNPARVVRQFDPTTKSWVLGSVRRPSSDNIEQPVTVQQT